MAADSTSAAQRFEQRHGATRRLTEADPSKEEAYYSPEEEKPGVA